MKTKIVRIGYVIEKVEVGTVSRQLTDAEREQMDRALSRSLKETREFGDGIHGTDGT